MRHGPALALLGIAVVIGWLCPASAQDASPQLTARTGDGQSTYYIGQRIPLELSFTGPDNKRYEINTATGDASGRMTYEQFEVTPGSGWIDPLATYYGSSMGYVGGGPGGIQKLSPKSAVIHLDLNEWVRFDQPGSYNVVVVSSRATDLSPEKPAPYGRKLITVRSNTIRVQIIPAPEAWQRAKLAALVTEISAKPTNAAVPPPDLKAALGDLRFLGTPAAVRVLAQQVRDDSLSGYGFFPWRELILSNRSIQPKITRTARSENRSVPARYTIFPGRHISAESGSEEARRSGAGAS